MNAKNIAMALLDLAIKAAIIIVAVMLISKYSRLAYNYGYRIYNQTPVSSTNGRTVTITIKEGDSVSDIANKLSNAGLITNKQLFKYQEKFSEYSGMISPGSYDLSTSMTPEEMIEIMAASNINAESGEGSSTDKKSSTKESSAASADSATDNASEVTSE